MRKLKRTCIRKTVKKYRESIREIDPLTEEFDPSQFPSMTNKQITEVLHWLSFQVLGRMTDKGEFSVVFLSSFFDLLIEEFEKRLKVKKDPVKDIPKEEKEVKE